MSDSPRYGHALGNNFLECPSQSLLGSDGKIARSKTMGRKKIAKVRELASAHG